MRLLFLTGKTAEPMEVPRPALHSIPRHLRPCPVPRGAERRGARELCGAGGHLRSPARRSRVRHLEADPAPSPGAVAPSTTLQRASEREEGARRLLSDPAGARTPSQ